MDSKKLISQGQRSLDLVDGLLDRLTSYRLVLYSVMAFVGWAIFASFIDEVAFEWYEILGSATWLVVVCVSANLALSKVLNIPRNKESDYISALILALILLPAQDFNDYLILAAAGAAAMLSKYVLVYGKRHIFNPAAIGAFTVGLAFDYFPAWWVGTTILVPLVFIAGQLILKKMKRYLMVTVFMGIYLGYLIFNYFNKDLSGGLWDVVWIGLTATPVLFFVYIMLTEPSTSPHRLPQMLVYAVVVGLLYSVTTWHFAPEEALLVGNLVAFAMAPHRRLELSLKERKREAKDIYSYVFRVNKKLKFAAGQYMEWTLPMAKADSRGNRRYFTLSSSPTEDYLMFTVREPTPSSSFKTQLDKLEEGDKMLAYQLEGSFVLPKDTGQKLALVAGGIGVTPFRSMVKYLADTGQSRDVRLFYSANEASQHAYKPLFKTAEKLGLKTLYVATKDSHETAGVHSGVIDKKVIAAFTPDWRERTFYVSGPISFVQYISRTLLDMGVKKSAIKTDYFPGYG